MRTDSVNLSKLCLNACKKQITETIGKEYVSLRQYQTSSKGAQEAHEAIRPTYMENSEIQGSLQERRLYDLIWKRTIASQMADAQIERTQATISISNISDCQFIASGEVITFEGFLKIYQAHNSNIEEEENESSENLLPMLKNGQLLNNQEILATEKFSQRPTRYNEASLVKKLEELGIGRPSTYATTITTIQEREYVQKGDKQGESFPYTIISLKKGKITSSKKEITLGAERGKLLPTDTGIVVNDFLKESFPEIMDYNFTAEVEKEFDDIAEGKAEWIQMIRKFYENFEPKVEQSINSRNEHRVGERLLGNHPKTGEPVMVKIGRFGPVAQIGSTDSEKKPRFAQLKKEQSLETITLEEAVELFNLPRELGEFDGFNVKIGAGKFGPYIHTGNVYISIPKETDPLTLTLEQAVQIILQYRLDEAKKHLKTFSEDPDLEVMAGRYGPYLVYKNQNYKLPKNLHDKAEQITYEECMEIINNAPAPTTKTTRKKK
jgi:DNA topoisomerase-1